MGRGSSWASWNEAVRQPGRRQRGGAPENRAADRSSRARSARASFPPAAGRCGHEYAAAFGRTETSIIGKNFVEIIGEAAAREVRPSVDLAVKERRAVADVRELTAADGTRRWIEANMLPKLAPDGTPLGAFVIVTDITGHRLATQALRESEERPAKFMQASAEGIAFHRDGIVSDAGPPLRELVGCTLRPAPRSPAAACARPGRPMPASAPSRARTWGWKCSTNSSRWSARASSLSEALIRWNHPERDLLQGASISGPLPAAELVRWVTARRAPLPA